MTLIELKTVLNKNSKKIFKKNVWNTIKDLG